MKTETLPKQDLPAVKGKTKTLFVQVDTLDVNGQNIGTRIVDLYHMGTRPWMANHAWWAMHNGAVVTQRPATQDEIDAYLAAQKAALVAKFAPDVAHVAVAS